MSIEIRWGLPHLDTPVSMTPIPNFILEFAASFGITPQELTMIMQLAAFKYETVRTQGSRPAVDTIAGLMGYSDDKQVRRMIKRLESVELLVVERVAGETSIYDFSALTEKCWDRYVEIGLPSKGVPPLKGGGDTPLKGRVVSPSKGSEEEKQIKESKKKKVAPTVTETHPLRKRVKNGHNPYLALVARFWSGVEYADWSKADRTAEAFRFNAFFSKGGAMELLYDELGGFTPEQLEQALRRWCTLNPQTPLSQRPRETKLYSHIAPLIKEIVAKSKISPQGDKKSAPRDDCGRCEGKGWYRAQDGNDYTCNCEETSK